MPLLNQTTRQRFSQQVDKPWFIPSLICVLLNTLGIGLSVGLAYFHLHYFFYPVSEVRQQAILGIIATSLTTLIGVTFSISMLILSTVSNQFGPRLLPNFIHSKITQITLGFFLGTFIFCLFSIYHDSHVVIRGMQTIYAFILTITCVIILVFFIHHVIESIQVNGILSLVMEEARKAFASGLPETNKHKKYRLPPHTSKKNSAAFKSEKNGYLQGIDYQKLTSLALKHQVIIDIHVRPGDYIYVGNQLMSIYSGEKEKIKKINDADLRATINIHHARLSSQDIEYGLEQIAEIAIRALSAGINDPYTARQCLFLLGELFIEVAKQQDIEQGTLGNEEQLAVLYKPFTYKGLIDTSLDRIRQASLNDLMVIIAFYDMIIQVVGLLKNKKIIQPLLKQGFALKEQAKDKKWATDDKNELKAREDKLIELAKNYEDE